MRFSLNGYTPPPTKRWQAGEDTINDLFERNRITFETGDPMLKYYEHEEQDEYAPFYCFIEKSVSGTAESGKELLNRMIGNTHGFDTVKPMGLLKYLISRVTDSEDIVLDSFGGSGTTAHAVLDLNKEEATSRRFILVEMDEHIAMSVTAPRLSAALTGYQYQTKKNTVMVEGLQGGFRYCRLGTPLFNEFGDIDAGVNFPDLAAHVFFSETGAPLPGRVDGSTSLIGQHRDKLVYLLFSPAEQGFAREAAGNVLTPDALAALPAAPEGFEGERIVYAEGCTVTAERLRAERVTFKQIPYQIEGA